MADLFISYARSDRAIIEKLAAALKAEGFAVWWDDDIRSGSEFSRDIETELAAAKAVIVCWSKTSVESRWVKDEANSGADGGKLLALTLDGTLPPIGFRQFHCTDFSHWRGNTDKPVFQQFMGAVREQVSGETTPPPPTPTARRRSPVLLALAALLLVPVAAYFLFPSWWGGASAQDDVAPVTMPRIAIAPVDVSGDEGELAAMATRLRSEVASGLARFPTLAVAAPGDDEGADYRLDMSLQGNATQVRLATQLIDLNSGEHVWGKRYDRTREGVSLLDLQDEMQAKVIAAIGDNYGAMLRDLQAQVAAKDPAALTPYEAVLRHNIYRQRLHPDDHLVTREALEKAAQDAPNDSNVWASLAAVRIEEIKHDYNRRDDAGDKALEAARQAVRADPNSAYAHFELAEVQYFLKNPGAFRAAAERSVELNPYDSEAIAMLGILSGYTGDWERGREWTRRAMELNPDHPGWYRFNHFFDAYRHGRYEEALAVAQRINQPEYFADPYVRAIVLVRLGRMEEASRAASEFVALWPRPLSEFISSNLATWMYAQPELQRMIIDDLTAAGVDFDGDA